MFSTARMLRGRPPPPATFGSWWGQASLVSVDSRDVVSFSLTSLGFLDFRNLFLIGLGKFLAMTMAVTTSPPVLSFPAGTQIKRISDFSPCLHFLDHIYSFLFLAYNFNLVYLFEHSNTVVLQSGSGNGKSKVVGLSCRGALVSVGSSRSTLSALFALLVHCSQALKHYVRGSWRPRMKAFLQRGCELQCGGRATWKPLLPVQEMQSFPGTSIFSVPSPALLSTRETVHAIPGGRESRRVACFILT